MKRYQTSHPDQEFVQEFVQTYNLEAPLQIRLLDLISELGEVAKELLAGTDYGRRPFSPSEAWSNEIGDLYFSLICLANLSEVDLSTALHRAVDKYRQRLNRTGQAGSETNGAENP